MTTKVQIQTEDTPPFCNTQQVKNMFNRVARTHNNADFLSEEIANRLLSKADDVKQNFPTVLDLGCGFGTLHRQAFLVQSSLMDSLWVEADISRASLQKNTNLHKIQLDMESALPFKNNSFSLVISNLALPWVNDLPNALIYMGRACAKGGLVLASLLGGESFKELKSIYAELEGNQYTPHFLPMVDVKDMGKLMQQTGFELPVSDRDLITIEYPNVDSLFDDLRTFGGKNLNLERAQGLTTPRKLQRVKEMYVAKYGDAEGNIPVTLEIIYIHGWRP